MLYSIPFQYTVLNEPATRQVAAHLIVDLPQRNLAEAQRNLLVYDLARYAYIRNCYLQDAAYLQKPESILQVYNGSLPTSSKQIKVVYQYAPNYSNWSEFILYIYLDNGGVTDFLPFTQVEFTCRDEYDIYYEAFLNDLLVCGVPMLPPQYEEGNLVKVCYGAVYELARITKDSNGQQVAVSIRNRINKNTIPVNNLTYSCIHGFNLTKEIMKMLGATWQKAGYNLGGGWYELALADSQQNNSVVLHIIKRDYRFFLIIDDDTQKAFYRSEEFFGFDGLQRLVKKEYGVNYMPSQVVLFTLEAYFKKLHSEVLLLMDLSGYISTFQAGTDVNLIISGIMQKYQLSYNEANHYYNICQIGK